MLQTSFIQVTKLIYIMFSRYLSEQNIFYNMDIESILSSNCWIDSVQIMNLNLFKLHKYTPLPNIFFCILSIILASFSWKVMKVHQSVNFCARNVTKWAAFRSFSGYIPISSPSHLFIWLECGKDPPSLVISSHLT